MFKHTLVVAALSSLTLAQGGIPIPQCAQPCLAQAQEISDCDLTQVTCLCKQLPILVGNVDIVTCLQTGCKTEEFNKLITDADTACNGPPSSSISISSDTRTLTTTTSTDTVVLPTSAPATSTVMYPNATMTSDGGSQSTPADTGPTTTGSGPTGTGPTGTTTPNVAGRSEFGMLALGIALVAALAL